MRLNSRSDSITWAIENNYLPAHLCLIELKCFKNDNSSIYKGFGNPLQSLEEHQFEVRLLATEVLWGMAQS